MAKTVVYVYCYKCLRACDNGGTKEEHKNAAAVMFLFSALVICYEAHIRILLLLL